MKSNKLNSLITLLILFTLFFSGIYRHDVKKEEYLKLANKKQFDCVGQIFQVSDSAPRGSCVLIGNKYVLTAAHVLEDYDTRTDSMINSDGQKVLFNTTFNEHITEASRLFVNFKGEKVRVTRIIIPMEYTDSLTKGSCDIALLEIEKPIPKFRPAKLNSCFDELNSKVIGVGYGASGPADRPDLVDSKNEKIAGENVIDQINGYKYHGRETLLECDFDSPTHSDCNKMGDSIPMLLEYICSGGDSGGALFRSSKRGWELVGICSGGGIEIEQFYKSFYYGQTMGWTRVSAFSEWINKEINSKKKL